LSGRVTLATRIRGVPLSTNAYTPRAVSRQESSATPEMLNVVVYLKERGYRGPLPATRRQIKQEKETFVPRVIAITRGSTLDFPNADPYFHNVFSLSGAGPFDLGRYPDGESRSRQFTKVGLVKVFCHIHSHMSASILVLDHPYFTIPDADGSFSISNVPPGDHTVVAWHERVGEQTAHIVVRPGQDSSIDISLPVPDGP
jgi:plastocyanin